VSAHRRWEEISGSLRGWVPQLDGEALYLPRLRQLESSEHQWQTVWKGHIVLSHRWKLPCRVLHLPAR
jgi:hypothetical protein